jgi:hypothetical protein
MAELRKRVEKQGFVGLKPYLNIGLKYSDPLFAPCWEYLDRRGLYALRGAACYHPRPVPPLRPAPARRGAPRRPGLAALG